MPTAGPGGWVPPDEGARWVSPAGEVTPLPSSVPPRRGSAGLLSAVAVAVVVLLVAGIAGAFVVKPKKTGSPRRAAASSTPSTAGPAISPAAKAKLDAVVVDLEAFVAKTRGLSFKQPVKVTLLADAAFRAKLRGDGKTDKAAVDKASKVLRALGLIGKGVDLAKADEELLGGAVVGFYDHKAKELYVRGADLTPYVREVLAHELTHALQDQYFDLSRPAIDSANDEQSVGFTALVEGDAVRVQRAYLDQLSGAERQAANTEEQDVGGGIPGDVPVVLQELLAFPYLVGPTFDQALIQHGGQAALDAAFAKPPTTSEQLLHPAVFLRGQGKVAVPAPKADGSKVIDRSDLGELGLLLLLKDAVSQKASLTAGDGWGGDTYVAWDEGKRTCVRDRMVMDSSKDRSEALAALKDWAGSRSGVTINASPGGGPSGVFEFTSCG